MNAETQPQRTYSEAEMGFQRIVNEGPHSAKAGAESKPGDFSKRIMLNTTMLVGGLGIDLAESAVAKWAIDKVFDPRIEGLGAKVEDLTVKQPEGYVELTQKAKDDIRITHSIKDGVKFVEEWGSDSAYAGMANSLIRTLTGVPEATYVKETAALTADWANAIIQVFYGDRKIPLFKWKGNTILATEMQNFVNPVDVEAAFRLLAEIPGVGWIKNKTDYTLEQSKVLRYTNIAASKGLLGFHITNSTLKKLEAVGA